jgi:hypothetical protein
VILERGGGRLFLGFLVYSPNEGEEGALKFLRKAVLESEWDGDTGGVRGWLAVMQSKFEGVEQQLREHYPPYPSSAVFGMSFGGVGLGRDDSAIGFRRGAFAVYVDDQVVLRKDSMFERAPRGKRAFNDRAKFVNALWSPRDPLLDEDIVDVSPRAKSVMFESIRWAGGSNGELQIRVRLSRT